MRLDASYVQHACMYAHVHYQNSQKINYYGVDAMFIEISVVQCMHSASDE